MIPFHGFPDPMDQLDFIILGEAPLLSRTHSAQHAGIPFPEILVLADTPVCMANSKLCLYRGPDI